MTDINFIDLSFKHAKEAERSDKETRSKNFGLILMGLVDIDITIFFQEMGFLPDLKELALQIAGRIGGRIQKRTLGSMIFALLVGLRHTSYHNLIAEDTQPSLNWTIAIELTIFFPELRAEDILHAASTYCKSKRKAARVFQNQVRKMAPSIRLKSRS